MEVNQGRGTEARFCPIDLWILNEFADGIQSSLKNAGLRALADISAV